MKTINRLVGVCALVGGCSGAVYAESVTDFATIEIMGNEWFLLGGAAGPLPVVAGSADLRELEQFNPFRGTLNSATLTFSEAGVGSSGSATVSGAVLTPGVTGATASVGMDLALDLPASSTVYPVGSGSAAGSCSTGSGSPACVSDPGSQFSLGIGGEHVFGGSDLAPFLGGGDLQDLSIDWTMQLLQVTPNPIDAGFLGDIQVEGTARFTVSVEYDFMPAVPLPAAAWLFGSALMGLVAVKRRKA